MLYPTSAVTLEPNHHWTDWLGQQVTVAGRLVPPSRQALVEWLGRQPDLRRLRLKAAGAGHSTSGVARPQPDGGITVDVSGLQLPAEEQRAAEGWWIRPDFLRPGEHLMRVAAGTTIEHLNDRLMPLGLALPNMGSYDHQSVAGAVSTGTHGTGLVTGPLCDFVVSVELVTILERNGVPTVVSLRIEPPGGPTDEGRFDGRHYGLELLRDAEAFHACVVGLGCFGIVTALTLKVVDAFWLEETRAIQQWPELAAGRRLLDLVEREAWFDVVMVPLPEPLDGRNHLCLTTARRRIPLPAGRLDGPLRLDERERAMREKMADKNFGMPGDPRARVALTDYLANLASNYPRKAADRARSALTVEAEAVAAQPFRSASRRVLRTSMGDLVSATSAEVAVPLERAVTAVDATIDHLRAMHELGYHHISPLGIRFGQASPHFLSMHYGRRTCTIEAPILKGVRADRHGPADSEADIAFMLGSFVQRLTAPSAGLEARVHWGQRHSATPELHRMYPRFDRWLAQMRRFNPFGIFDNDHSHAWTIAPIPGAWHHHLATHGHDLSLERPADFESVWRAGFGVSLRGRPGASTWVHLAVPTPVIANESPMRVEGVGVRFRTDPGSFVRSVHVFDGELKIASDDDIWEASHTWIDRDLRLGTARGMHGGLGISLLLTFGGAETARTIELGAASARFEGPRVVHFVGPGPAVPA